MFDDAVSMIQSVRASWAPQVDERERASAEHRHRERLVAYQKRQSMRIEAERELLERHLRLGHEDARREAARKARRAKTDGEIEDAILDELESR